MSNRIKIIRVVVIDHVIGLGTRANGLERFQWDALSRLRRFTVRLNFHIVSFSSTNRANRNKEDGRYGNYNAKTYARAQYYAVSPPGAIRPLCTRTVLPPGVASGVRVTIDV